MRLLKAVEHTSLFILRFIVGTAFAFFIVIGLDVGRLQLTPMSHWVDFRNVKLDYDGNRYALIIDRYVPETIGAVTVNTYTEIYLSLESGGQSIAGCSSRIVTQSETQTGPIVRAPLARLLPACDLPKLIGKKVELQFVVEIELPYTIRKRRRFVIGPFVYGEPEDQRPSNLR